MTPTSRNPPPNHGNPDHGQPAPPPSIDSSDDESLSIHPVASNRDGASLHVSLGPDDPVEHYSSFVEVPDAVYERFPRHRKALMVVLLSFCSFLSPISSTSVLAATPEVAAEYGTTGAVINLANAMYMLTMGISPVFWAPMSEVYGRRRINQITAVLFCACSIGTALAPNLAAFFVFRILTAFEGTAFILVGSACIGDIYRPTERATALGWFLLGTLVGPAFGPFIGGIIVTYTSWRVIFYLQTGLAALAALFAFTPFLPETIHVKKIDAIADYSPRQKLSVLLPMINPGRVFSLLAYPNLIVAMRMGQRVGSIRRSAREEVYSTTKGRLASSAVIWNMYSLLTPIRYVLNPRFHLDTPLQGGLFYLAPGCGYLVGTLVGGRYADYVVRDWIRRRGGVRVPEDRLRSALPFMGVVIPACVLVYGWGVDQNVGGIPLAVVAMFLQGVAQLFCFPSLNTYCLDVMQGRGSEVIAGNYFVRYLFACGATACALPAIEAVGVGWFSTVSALFLMASAGATWATVRWGRGWRETVDGRRRARRVKAQRAAKAALNKKGEKAEVRLDKVGRDGDEKVEVKAA